MVDYTVRWSDQKTGQLREKGFEFEGAARRFQAKVKGQIFFTYLQRQDAAAAAEQVAPAPKAAPRAYDPGTPTTDTIRPLGENQWAIDSFRGAGSYIVTLGEQPSCSCPQWVNRCQGTDQQCKHQVTVIDFLQAEKQQRAERFAHLAELAGTVEDGELDRLIAKYRAVAAKGEVLVALLGEQWDRWELSRAPQPVAAPSYAAVLANARAWGRGRRDARLKAIFA